MTKAEEKAIDAWAIYEYREHPKGLYHTCFVDGYQEGYSQAEKDLALTWEDMRSIYEIICGIDAELSALPYGLGYQEYWEEVLRRFNKSKGRDEQH